MREFLHSLPIEIEKAVFLLVVLCVAYLVQRILGKLIRRVLASEYVNMPSASIFVNIMRIAIYAFAVIIVLKPVFGIDPTALVTALGIGGLAVSLGMKDTVANIIAGIQITVSRTLHPGDHVRIAGITGTVSDITWRQTNIVSRNREVMAVPNAVINTSSLVIVPPDVEAFVAIPFTAQPDCDPKELEQEIIEASYRGAAERLYPRDTNPTCVKFLSFDPYGIKGEIWLTVLHGYPFGSTKDLVVRELIGNPHFTHLSDDHGPAEQGAL